MAPTPKSPGTFGQIFQHIIQEQRPRINIITFSWVTQLNYWHWSDAKPSDQQKAIKLKPAREVPRLGPIAKGPFCQWHILHPIPTMLIILSRTNCLGSGPMISQYEKSNSGMIGSHLPATSSTLQHAQGTTQALILLNLKSIVHIALH